MFSVTPYDHAEQHIGRSVVPSVGGIKEDIANRTKAKISKLAVKQKGDDSAANMHAMFNDYGGEKKCLDKNDIVRLLNDAGVKEMLANNGKIADGILDDMNTSGTRCLTWDEYKARAGIVEEEPHLIGEPPVDKTPEPTPAKGGITRTSLSDWRTDYGLGAARDLASQTVQLTPEEETARRKAVADELVRRKNITTKSGQSPVQAAAGEAASGMGNFLFVGLLIAIPAGIWWFTKKN